MERRIRVAFITTDEYREKNRRLIKKFVYSHFYTLCTNFEILSTGHTYDLVKEILQGQIRKNDREQIEKDTKFKLRTTANHERWRTPIKKNLRKLPASIIGMILLTHELVEGRLDAIIHLTDLDDVATKPDSMVLRREANVHDVPIASDYDSAVAMIGYWKRRLETESKGSIFRKRKSPASLPLSGLKKGGKTLALIAHDNMKLPMCHFFIENATKIFTDYKCILATGTTGEWLQKFALAAGRKKSEIKKIRLCLSGPKGGDIQIATAVVKGLCRKVIFLQDPFTSHPHETDIRLFEQAILLFQKADLTPEIDLKLATNLSSARAILGI